MTNFFFFYITSKDSLFNPSSWTSDINDIAYLVKEDPNCSLIMSPNLTIDERRGVFVKNTACHPNNCIFLFDDLITNPYESLLFHLGFRAINFDISKRIANNRILCRAFLSRYNLKLIPYTINSPFTKFPFIIKTLDHDFGDDTKLIFNELDYKNFKEEHPHTISEFYIKKAIQCDYKILVFLDIILGAIIRINPKIYTFEPELDDIALKIPIKPSISLLDLKIRAGEKIYRHLEHSELTFIKEAFQQEKITLNRRYVPQVSKNFLPFQLALNTVKVLKLGLAQVHILTDKLNQAYVLDVDTKLTKTSIHPAFGKEKIYQLIKDRVDFSNAKS